MLSPTLFEKHHDLIKDQSFLKLGLLESHDSCSSLADPGKGIISDQMLINRLNELPSIIRQYGLKEFCDDFAKTQTLDVMSQLMYAGVRSLDVRVCTSTDGTLFVHHTFFIYPLSDLFTIIRTFLSAHPLELVQLKLKWTDTQTVTDLSVPIGQVLSSSGLLAMAVPNQNRYDLVKDLITHNQRLFIFVDHIASSPARPDWAAGYLAEYLDRYIETNNPNNKIALLNAQINQIVTPSSSSNNERAYLYSIAYTITPDVSDYVQTVVSSCCGLFKSKTSLALTDLNDGFPDITKAFTPFVFQKVANNVCMDFIKPSLILAEWLLTNGASPQ
jgi:hypothetical protein